MNDVETKKKHIINITYFAIIIAAFYLFVKYAMGICYPIIFAFIVAALLQRPVKFISRKTPVKKGIASVICVFVLLFVFGSIVYVIGFKAFTELRGFVDTIMAKIENTSQFVNDINQWLNLRIASLPEGLRSLVSSASDSLFAKINEFIANDSQAAGQTAQQMAEQSTGLPSSFSFSWISTPLSGVISTASKIPSILVGILVSIITSCFLTADYESFSDLILRQFTDEKRSNYLRAKQLLKESLGKMGKAYAIIIFITFVEMSVGLSVLKLAHIYDGGYIVIISLCTAIVDILPVLGTGTILVPWAVYSLIVGNIGMAVGIIIIYAMISVIRQVIEPKLVAGQLGLSPVLTITALYLGLKLFGVIGMLVMPILVVMVKMLNDEGIIHLWVPAPEKPPEEKGEGLASKLIAKIKTKKK
ncbi:MAG: sporulation integral membrane protein YtvI [Clostridia bacterium]|nr:sporulation integral membrane protein YtvI [Clostridia bacterium]